MARIIPIDPDHPDEEAVCEIVKVLNTGAMIIFPAETLYGLGVDSGSEKAVERLYKHKKRAADKPVPVMASDMDMVLTYAVQPSGHGIRLMEAFWPGPLTLVCKAQSNVIPLITGNTGTIGIRVPGSIFCRNLARKMKRAVTATSANYSGEPACSKIWDIPERLRQASALILHGGETSGAKPSTVVSVFEDPPMLIREGAISREAVETCLGIKLT